MISCVDVCLIIYATTATGKLDIFIAISSIKDFPKHSYLFFAIVVGQEAVKNHYHGKLNLINVL